MEKAKNFGTNNNFLKIITITGLLFCTMSCSDNDRNDEKSARYTKGKWSAAINKDKVKNNDKEELQGKLRDVKEKYKSKDQPTEDPSQNNHPEKITFKKKLVGDFGTLVYSVKADELFFEPFPGTGSYMGNRQLWDRLGEFMSIPSEFVFKMYDSCGITKSTPPEKAIHMLKNYVHNNLKYISDPNDKEFLYCTEQTILNGGGDCEDLTLLMINLILPLNELYGTDDIKLIFVMYEDSEKDSGHALMGITGIGNVTGKHYSYGSQKYYLLECTKKYSKLGNSFIPETAINKFVEIN